MNYATRDPQPVNRDPVLIKRGISVAKAVVCRIGIAIYAAYQQDKLEREVEGANENQREEK